jgi:hypothetical protein
MTRPLSSPLVQSIGSFLRAQHDAKPRTMIDYEGALRRFDAFMGSKYERTPDTHGHPRGKLQLVDAVATLGDLTIGQFIDAATGYAADGIAPNIWLGTSVEDQRAADERIPHLLATPAEVRFISAEPLLGPLDVRRFLADVDGTMLDGPRLDWVIVGGESGSRARPMDLAWARSLVRQCRAASVPVFVKQLGSKPYERVDTLAPGYAFNGGDLGVAMSRPHSELQERGFTRITTATQTYFQRNWHSRESHGRNPDEWPEDLRVRQWPR